MSARMDEVRSQLALRRAELESFLADLPQARWHERPATGGWTIAEIVDHLRVVEDSCTRVIRKLMQVIRETSVPADADPTGPLLPIHGPLALLLDRTRKVEAPPFVAPSASPDPAQAHAGLQATRRALLATLEEAEGMPLGAVSRPHPAVGPLNGYEWALSIAEHEARHVAQAREIVASLG